MRSLFHKGHLLLRAGIGALLVATLGASAPAPSVDIVASNWKFTPAKIEAHVGQPITLKLSSSEGVHGLESADVGIPKTMMVPGKTVTVTVTPKKAGTYDLHCAVVCGAGHENMTLTVNVVP